MGVAQGRRRRLQRFPRLPVGGGLHQIGEVGFVAVLLRPGPRHVDGDSVSGGGQIQRRARPQHRTSRRRPAQPCRVARVYAVVVGRPCRHRLVQIRANAHRRRKLRPRVLVGRRLDPIAGNRPAPVADRSLPVDPDGGPVRVCGDIGRSPRNPHSRCRGHRVRPPAESEGVYRRHPVGVPRAVGPPRVRVGGAGYRRRDLGPGLPWSVDTSMR